MGKHTEGPWERLIFSNHEIQTDFAMVKIGGRVHMVGYSQEDCANALLIASAPDLLDALTGMLALDEQHSQRYSGDEDVCAEVRTARAAIARARGEA